MGITLLKPVLRILSPSSPSETVPNEFPSSSGPEYFWRGEGRFVMPAHAGIQVTDSVRHTVGKRYPGHGGLDPGFHRGDEIAWIPAGVYPERSRRAGMTG